MQAYLYAMPNHRNTLQSATGGRFWIAQHRSQPCGVQLGLVRWSGL